MFFILLKPNVPRNSGKSLVVLTFQIPVKLKIQDYLGPTPRSGWGGGRNNTEAFR